MSGLLTLVAVIEAKPDKTAFIKAELLKLIAPTRAEAGCIKYDLHQDNDRPEIFMFYETWETRDLWQDHMNNDHLKVYMAATEGCVENFTMYEMSEIDT